MCYASFKNKKWIVGYAFDTTTDYNKAYAISLITGRDIKNFLGRRNNG